MKVSRIFLSLVLLLACVLVPLPKAEAAGEPIVKVKLKNYLKDQTEILLTPTGDYKTNDTNVVLKSGQTYKLKVYKTSLRLYQGKTRLASVSSFTATPAKKTNTLSINNRPYAGSFEFVTEKIGEDTFVRPINTVGLEQYLKGVVPHEMYASWPKEALKAQAVAARNYAITKVNTTIDDTISFQVYGGLEGVHANSNAAVDETAGYVLKYNGSLISALYSASNGGMTESNVNAWGGASLPYYPIKKDSYDPKPAWSFTVKKTQIDLTEKDLALPEEWWDDTVEADKTITDNIKKWLITNEYKHIKKDLKIVSIPTLKLTDPTSGGRVSKGSITVEYLEKEHKDEEGNLQLITKEYKNVNSTLLRTMIGNLIMRSYLIENISSTKSSVKVEGLGNGHGVGMSQWGAMYRANAGHTYKQILSFYYPSATLVKEYEIKKDTTPPIIKDIKATYSSKTDKVTVNFNLNESTKTTVYVRDSKNKIIKYLAKDKAYKKGTKTRTWDVSKVQNGTYTIVVKSTDLSGNKSSAVKKFKLSKPYKTGKVTATSLNIRQKPSTTAKVVGTVKKNQIVTVYSKTGSWYKIKYGKVTGYVHASYVTNVK